VPITKPEANTTFAGQSDAERFGDILAVQRGAYQRDGHRH
jgi:hypothetical protein